MKNIFKGDIKLKRDKDQILGLSANSFSIFEYHSYESLLIKYCEKKYIRGVIDIFSDTGWILGVNEIIYNLKDPSFWITEILYKHQKKFCCERNREFLKNEKL